MVLVIFNAFHAGDLFLCPPPPKTLENLPGFLMFPGGIETGK